MKKTIIALHFDLSDALREKVDKNIIKLQHKCPYTHIKEINTSLKIENLSHICKIRITTNNKTYVVVKETMDMYKSIDAAFEVITRNIQEDIDKYTTRKRKVNIKNKIKEEFKEADILLEEEMDLENEI